MIPRPVEDLLDTVWGGQSNSKITMNLLAVFPQRSQTRGRESTLENLAIQNIGIRIEVLDTEYYCLELSHDSQAGPSVFISSYFTPVHSHTPKDPLTKKTSSHKTILTPTNHPSCKKGRSTTPTVRQNSLRLGAQPITSIFLNLGIPPPPEKRSKGAWRCKQ